MTDMRRRIGVLAAGAATVALVATPLAALADSHEGAMVSEACQAANIDDLLKNPGRLTLSTDNPAFPPWWGGDPSVDTDEIPWEVSYPPSGEGLEGGVAYAVAKALGFAEDQVDWLKNTEFTLAFQPGPKDFDAHMAQIAIRPDRADNVDFSEPYFDLSQALVAVAGNDITNVTSMAEVKPFNLGVALGTTALQFVEEQILPDTEPQVFNNNADAVQALQNGQIDGLIVDLGSSFYVSGVQVENGTIVAQFPTSEQDERVAFVLEKESPLTACISEAVLALKESGELQEIYDAMITQAQSVPVIE